MYAIVNAVKQLGRLEKKTLLKTKSLKEYLSRNWQVKSWGLGKYTLWESDLELYITHVT